MTEQNDGRIPGGPTTDHERQERESHISRLVFSGDLYDYPSSARIREHGRWRHVRDDPNSARWELTSQQKNLVESFGFGYINDIEFLQHDRDLIFSLAERWWPNRNTFQLPVGEMTVTLWDVANILGLPINGDPIYFSERHDTAGIIQQYLGVPAPTGQGQRSRSDVNLSWLRTNFMYLGRTADGPVVVDENRILCCTRAYLLALCGSILFPNGTGCKVSVRFLPFMENLHIRTRHAWGAAVLAFLYASLSEFVKINGDTVAMNLCGCMMLLQAWSYEQFAIGRPITSCTRLVDMFPAARRWTVACVDYAHCRYQSASIYRAQFDVLFEHEVAWFPYFMGPNAPEIQRMSWNYSLHRYYVICDCRIMYHPADRVLRQFMIIQTIPSPPLPSNYSHAKVASRIRSILPGWESRYERYSIVNISVQARSRDELYGNTAYIRWWGAPRMANQRYRFEETRFANIQVDECSMRTIINKLGEFTIEMERSLIASRHMTSDRWQPLAVDMIERIVTWVKDSCLRGPEPNMPHVVLPDDYPSGFVRRRQSRYTPVQQQEEEEASEQEEEEGTSYPVGEGTSYPVGEGTSYPVGEGTSYPIGEGTSYQAARASFYEPGEGSSYPVGEGSSYPVARASSYEPGEWCYSTPSAPLPTQAYADTQEQPIHPPESQSDAPEPENNHPNLRPNRRKSYLRWIMRGRST